MKASYLVFKSRWESYVCAFYLDGYCNSDERGTDGTGVKLYDSKEKAEAAGKRYLKKMKQNGFEI